MEFRAKVVWAVLLVLSVGAGLDLLKFKPFSASDQPVRARPAPRAQRPAMPTNGNSVTVTPRSVVVENDTLSLALHDQPLGPVLTEIARASRVAINSVPAINDRRVTIELHGAPLARGLQELLGDSDVFLYTTSGHLHSVWIYESKAGATLRPVPPESWASTADVERRLNDPAPAQRILAIETLVARSGPDAGDIVTRALLDEDAEVRLRALDVALSAGVIVSRDTLTGLTSDSYPPVRALALDAIASATPLGGPQEAEVEQLMQRMMGDPDPDVRRKAGEILASRHPTD